MKDKCKNCRFRYFKAYAVGDQLRGYHLCTAYICKVDEVKRCCRFKEKPKLF